MDGLVVNDNPLNLALTLCRTGQWSIVTHVYGAYLVWQDTSLCAYAGTSHTAELALCQLCNHWSPPGTGIYRHDKHRCHPWRQSWHHALVIRDVSYANPEVCWLKNILTPRQNDRNFSNNSFNCNFLYKHFRSLIQIAQKDIPEVSISNKL